MSLYCEAKLEFLAESKMSMKIHFRSTSALSQCFEVSEMKREKKIEKIRRLQIEKNR